MLICRAEQPQRRTALVAPLAVSRKDSHKFDLPIPASPETCTTWPCPAQTRAQHWSRTPRSEARPKLPYVHGVPGGGLRARASRQAGTGLAKPLSWCVPRYSHSKPPCSRSRVSAEITTQFGWAMLCSRAARLGALPMAGNSLDVPSPICSPSMTTPVAMTTRTAASEMSRGSSTACFAASPTMSNAARAARSGARSRPLVLPKYASTLSPM